MELVVSMMPRDYVIVVCSDLHFGAPNCHKDGIREMVNKVASKKNYYLIYLLILLFF